MTHTELSTRGSGRGCGVRQHVPEMPPSGNAETTWKVKGGQKGPNHFAHKPCT